MRSLQNGEKDQHLSQYVFLLFFPVICEGNLKQVFCAVICLLIYMSIWLYAYMVKDKEALIWGRKRAGYGRGRIEHV